MLWQFITSNYFQWYCDRYAKDTERLSHVTDWFYFYCCCCSFSGGEYNRSAVKGPTGNRSFTAVPDKFRLMPLTN